MDWPSGPSTIHSVGTRCAGPTLCTARRCQISVMITKDAISDSPNIA